MIRGRTMEGIGGFLSLMNQKSSLVVDCLPQYLPHPGSHTIHMENTDGTYQYLQVS
jgi:hypothetical protein